MKDMINFVRSEFALKTRFLRALLTLCFGAFGMVPLAGLGVAQENAPFTVEADELLEWDQTKGTYRATGNALARQEDQQIKAMELVASYDTNSESRKITLIVATGAVEYEDETSTASGDKLTYYIDAERYLIEGAKSLVTGPNGTMRASKSIELLSPTTDKQLLQCHCDTGHRSKDHVELQPRRSMLGELGYRNFHKRESTMSTS